MKILTEQSIRLLDNNLKYNNIYFISSLPIKTTIQDAGCSLDPSILSHKWIYGRNGLLNNLEGYNTFSKRVAEFYDMGDYLNTLRQRLNIVNELIACDLDTNLPLHLSTRPYHEGDIVLDLEDPKDFLFVVHPGQTRVQGSVFLRAPLKNVFLYINKKYKNVSIKQYPFIKKIETVEQLLTYYRTYTKLDKNQKALYDFYLPKTEFGLKYHKETDVYILKCNNISNLNRKKEEKKVLQHTSTYYLPNTFLSMNSFCKLFFNNTFNIYTNDKNKLKKILLEESKHFLSINELKQDNLNTTGGYSRPLDPYPGIFEKSLSKKEIEFITKYIDLIHTTDEQQHKTIDYNIIKTQDLDSKKIVQQNQKGITIIIDSNKIQELNRNIYELLFCIPSTHTLTRNKENSVKIINCEHEYWTTEKNYKEYILSEDFFKVWKQ